MTPARTADRASAIRRITVQRLVSAHRDCVPVTLTTTARAEGILAARSTGAPPARRRSVTAILVPALIRALRRHPDLNAVIDDGNILPRDDIRLGIAVARADGELALAVLDCPDGAPHACEDGALDALIERARDGSLGRNEVSNASFLLSNLGRGLAPLHGTPALVPGATGGLLVGGAYQAPVVTSGEIHVGQVIDLSLTFDHRVVNGVPAAAFLAYLVDLLEDPLCDTT